VERSAATARTRETAALQYTASEFGRLFDLQESDELFERLIKGLYRGLLRPGDQAVDGGAHLGLHTVPLSCAVGRRGRVYAFEPLLAIAEQLERRVSARGNVTVRRQALGAQDGTATFYALPDSLGLSSLRDRPLAQSPRSIELEVAVVRLDTLATEPIRFLKLDLEGGEFHALLGARELLARQSPVVAFECGRIGSAGSYGYTSEEFFALFADAGYGLVTLFGQSFTPDDFQRGWDDRVVPHYLVAAPHRRLPALATQLRTLTREALTTPEWRWRMRRAVDVLRPRIAALPGMRFAWRRVRAVIEASRT